MMTERHMQAQKEKPVSPAEQKCEQIGIEDFFKTELKVALVLSCEKVEKSKKLLKFRLSLGTEERTVVSGIAAYYTPEELVGKRVILVSNLKPAVLCGIESNGMILCADEGDKVTLICPPEDVKIGSRVR